MKIKLFSIIAFSLFANSAFSVSNPVFYRFKSIVQVSTEKDYIRIVGMDRATNQAKAVSVNSIPMRTPEDQPHLATQRTAYNIAVRESCQKYALMVMADPDRFDLRIGVERGDRSHMINETDKFYCEITIEEAPSIE